MKFSFYYKNKRFDIDVKECETVFSQMTGLMFRRKSKSLLFIFKKPNKIRIHSFFCVPFIAIWFIDNKIIDIKFVKPWKISIKPKSRFNKLLEIPINDKNFSKLKNLLDY